MLKFLLKFLSLITGKPILLPEVTKDLQLRLERLEKQNQSLDQMAVRYREELHTSKEKHKEQVAQLKAELARVHQEALAAQAQLREEMAQLSINADQETLRQLDENKSLMEQLTWLSGTIAHDFRAPLRAIDAYSFFLDDELGDAAPQESRGSLDEIRRNSKRMGILIDGLLDFMRLSACTLNLAKYDLGDAAREVINLYHPQASIEIETDLHFPIKGDQELCVRMMKELIDNAVKFSANVDQPLVKIRKCGNYEIEIVDNGVGFSDEHKDKMFRLFHRMHGNDEYEGEGIGLCIAQRIATRHQLALKLTRVGEQTVASLRFKSL